MSDAPTTAKTDQDVPDEHVARAAEDAMNSLMGARRDHEDAEREDAERRAASRSREASSHQPTEQEDLSPAGKGLPYHSSRGTSSRTGWREAWQKTMQRSGIPPRFQEAHLSNCRRYAEASGKQEALALAEAFAEEGNVFQRGQRRCCLLLSGGYGTGKTWLATAVFKTLLFCETRQGLWRKFYGFIREVQGTYSVAAERSVDQVLSGYQNTRLLCLDDLGDLERPVQSDDRRRLVYEVLDARNDQFKPTIITTNLNEQELAEQFGERTFERIKEMCALVGMEGANLRDAS